MTESSFSPVLDLSGSPNLTEGPDKAQKQETHQKAHDQDRTLALDKNFYFIFLSTGTDGSKLYNMNVLSVCFSVLKSIAGSS